MGYRVAPPSQPCSAFKDKAQICLCMTIIPKAGSSVTSHSGLSLKPIMTLHTFFRHTRTPLDVGRTPRQCHGRAIWGLFAAPIGAFQKQPFIHDLATRSSWWHTHTHTHTHTQLHVHPMSSVSHSRHCGTWDTGPQSLSGPKDHGTISWWRWGYMWLSKALWFINIPLALYDHCFTRSTANRMPLRKERKRSWPCVYIVTSSAWMRFLARGEGGEQCHWKIERVESRLIVPQLPFHFANPDCVHTTLVQKRSPGWGLMQSDDAQRWGASHLRSTCVIGIQEVSHSRTLDAVTGETLCSEHLKVFPFSRIDYCK